MAAIRFGNIIAEPPIVLNYLNETGGSLALSLKTSRDPHQDADIGMLLASYRHLITRVESTT